MTTEKFINQFQFACYLKDSGKLASFSWENKAINIELNRNDYGWFYDDEEGWYYCQPSTKVVVGILSKVFPRKFFIKFSGEMLQYLPQVSPRNRWRNKGKARVLNAQFA